MCALTVLCMPGEVLDGAELALERAPDHRDLRVVPAPGRLELLLGCLGFNYVYRNVKPSPGTLQ